MLKLAGEFEVGREKVEVLTYSPGLQDTGDKEGATKTIALIAEASGVGNADYSSALTLASPSDARLAVKRLCARLSVNIAGLGTATHVYCRVYVDQQDAGYRLFDEDWTSVGAKLDAVDTHAGNKATIFNLLKDGSAHTFYFFFWADAANQATINVVQLWETVGSCSTSWDGNSLAIMHKGLVSLYIYLGLLGTGSRSGRLVFPGTYSFLVSLGTESAIPTVLIHNHEIMIKGTVATDLNRLDEVIVVLRSEQ